MSTSLPERPNLDQLRRQAKELRDAARRGEADALDRFEHYPGGGPPGPVTLAAAQLVVARELGFPSWPKLKVVVETGASSPEGLADAFVAASVERRLDEAASFLDAHPDIAGYSIYTATVVGDTHTVREMLSADPPAATATDEARGWPPLLYACYSRWHQIDRSRSADMAEVVRPLLEAGASPITNNGARNGYRSALCGAVEVNNPGVTGALLDAGANPDDHQCIGEAAGQPDHRCLELLLSHGARVAGTWAVSAAVYADDAHSGTNLLEGG